MPGTRIVHTEAMASSLGRGRVAFEERRWGEALAELQAADAAAAHQSPIDLERLAVAAFMAGYEAEATRAWERANAAHTAADDKAGAGRCAFWVGVQAMLAGSIAVANGWFARADRCAEALPDGHPLKGYVLLPEAWAATASGDHDRALQLGAAAEVIGIESQEPDLAALATFTVGEACLAAGQLERGLRRLDEAMVAVSTGELSPIPAGIVYCAVIETCVLSYDLRRAAEWTEALAAWCEEQPDMVPYRGQCLIHRAQVLQAHGAWRRAAEEAQRARRVLSDPVHPALGAALFQAAEIARVQGDLSQAEGLYREAAAHGHSADPGLALLRLAQGDVAAAAAATKRMLRETTSPLHRIPCLAAATEILIAAGDLEGAEQAAEMLGAAAAGFGVVPHALWARARGAVLLASGRLSEALELLREATRTFGGEQMPYEVAATTRLIGEAHLAMEDLDNAILELTTARDTLRELGATTDWQLLDARIAEIDPSNSGAAADSTRNASVLSGREVEVLACVAEGLTNRQTGARLHISEHTVARHLQNIFNKTGCTSRAAAVAHAHSLGLMPAR